jgi:hypothetical protein
MLPQSRRSSPKARREFGTAGAQRSGDADDLARGDTQVHRMDGALARHLSQLHQRRRSGGGSTQGRDRPLSRREFVPHHRSDQPAAVQFRSDVLSDAPAIAQHRHAVRDRINLVEEVRDEQDGHALAAQAPHDREQLRHLLLVQARSGLIQDQHARGDTGGARDGHHLPDGHGIRAERP